MRIVRRARELAGALALVLAAPLAHADGTEDRRALMIAGQVMRNNGRLVRAREILRSCATDACGDADKDACEEIRAYCTKKAAEIEPEVPSIAIHVLDDRGLPVREASVRVDADTVDGLASVDVDPGRHVVRATYAGRSASAEVIVARGQKNAPVRVALDLRRDVTARPTPWYVYTLGTVAGIASLTAIGFGIAAQAQAGQLGPCSPTCDPRSRGLFEATTITVDVSLLVAAATALGGVFAYLLRPSVKHTIHIEQGIVGGGS